MPWYRQYFWLLLFGGIILVTAIISFGMICVCRTQLSKRVKVRIQKSFKHKRQHKSTILKDNSIYHSSGASKVKLPNRMEKDFVISENSISVLPPSTYAIQMPPRVPTQGLYPEYYFKKENTNLDIHNPYDRYSSASYDSVGSISEVNYSNTAAAVLRDREYVEVIADDADYDDVELSTLDVNYHWTNKPPKHRNLNIPDTFQR